MQLQAKAGDRALVFRAGLLTIEGGGLQAWFAARDPNKLEVMKVRATWIQTNILDVGWHRSEMERWDEVSAAGSSWKAFDNTIDPGINPFVRCLQSLLPQPPQPMQIDEQQPPESSASQGPSQPQQSRLQEITRTAAALGKQRVVTKEQALAIDMAPGINDTADAEIFFWQLTGREWNGSRSSYHMEATQKWRRLRKSEEAAASARDANAAQHADARVLQKMAEEIDNDFGVRIVQMVAVLLTNTTKHMPHMISKDLQEGGAELEALSATLGSVLPAPLAGKDVVTGSVLIGRSAMLALRMLCELEDSLGVQGLTDWDARAREYQTRTTFPLRVHRVIDTVRSWSSRSS